MLLFDFDGSLSSIVDHPGDARPLPGVVAVLERLSRRFGRVGIVSGRPVAFLAEHVPVAGLALVGQYGIESMIDGVVAVDARTAPYVAGVAAAAEAAEAQLPGIVVERKGTTAVTLHWRMASEREPEVVAVAVALADRYGLDVPHRGRKAVELRPPVPVDKGAAVVTLIDGFRVGAFAGDDLGDLPAFEALGDATRTGALEDAIRIGVTSAEMPVEFAGTVDAVVAGPTGLLELLELLARQVGS